MTADKDIIVLNKKEITKVAVESGKLVLKAKADESLLQFLKHRDYINELYETIKAEITKAGLSLDPEFAGIIGENVKASLRAYGSKYSYDKSDEVKLRPFLKESINFTVDADLVDKYRKEVGELPDGIIEVNRKKSMDFTYKKGDK